MSSSEETEVKYNFPKVELHCHLDHCWRVETIAELGKKRLIKIPSYDPEVLREHIAITKPCSKLVEYLDMLALAHPAFAGDAEAIKRTTKEAVQDRAKDGVTYVELRYTPETLANCDVKPRIYADEGRLRPKDVVEVINAAVKEAEYEHNIRVRTILSCYTLYDWGRQIAELCREYANQGVVGFDIQGPDREFSPMTIQSYEFCRQNGIHRTAHAGEGGPGFRVKEAVELLHAERIGHGYHIFEDMESYSLARKRGIHFEVCPLSSRLTGSVKGPWSSHPAVGFMKDGVDFSLSTDCPGAHECGFTGDYDIATKEWGFTIQDIQNLNLNAAKASFLDDTEKRQLIGDLKREYKEFIRNI